MSVSDCHRRQGPPPEYAQTKIVKEASHLGSLRDRVQKKYGKWALTPNVMRAIPQNQ